MNVELPEIPLWQQYKSSRPIVQYWIFFKEYIQKKYIDNFYSDGELGIWLKQLSINNNRTEFLYYYVFNILGQLPPYIITDLVTYDSGFDYDKDLKYDSSSKGEKVSMIIFQKILKFVYNWNFKQWNIVTLVKLVAEFCNIPVKDINSIAIDYSETRFNTFILKVPDNDYSHVLQILFRQTADMSDVMDNNVFNLPVGMKIEIELY